MTNKVDEIKKDIKKKILIGISAIFLPIFVILMIVIIVLVVVAGPQRLMPQMEEDTLNELQRKATHCDVQWEELLGYLTVRYENEFDDLNVEEEIIQFVIVRYDEYHKEVDTDTVEVPDENGGTKKIPVEHIEWVYDGTYNLETPSEIRRFAKKTGFQGGGITDLIDHIRSLDGMKEYNIFITSKEVKDFLGDLSDDQREWYNVLISENLIKVSAGTYYELPEDIALKSNGYFSWPVPGMTRITSVFGWRKDPVYGGRGFHAGVDVAEPGCEGTPIGASADGVVILVQYKTTGYGNNVVIEHIDGDGNHWQTRYGHMSQIEVELGETVSKGHVIGAIGSTGKSTGAHLHFEIKYEGTNVDPLQLVIPE